MYVPSYLPYLVLYIFLSESSHGASGSSVGESSELLPCVAVNCKSFLASLTRLESEMPKILVNLC